VGILSNVRVNLNTKTAAMGEFTLFDFPVAVLLDVLHI
jgi:hypothetical protein